VGLPACRDGNLGAGFDLHMRLDLIRRGASKDG
jgi:hypothetical protein